MTLSGLLVGTPGYMAPEQAGGRRALVGPATDIYALGVLLYQLLTGQLPFQSDSTLELLRAVTADEPARPRRLQPRVPRDLEAITLHCLEKEPGRRYPSALALAEDLRRFREGEPVVARPVGAVARLARACRRRPLVALLLALLGVSLLGGLGGVTWKWREANGNATWRTPTQAEAEKQAALYQAYRASLAAASAALAEPRRGRRRPPPRVGAGGPARLGMAAPAQPARRQLLGDPVARRGDGFLIAAPDQLRIGVLTGAGLRLTDLEGGEHRTLPIGPERRRDVSVTQTRRGLRVAAWVGNTAFDLLDDAGQVLCRVAMPENDGARYRRREPGRHTAVRPDGRRDGRESRCLTRLPGSKRPSARATATPSGLSPSARTARGSPRAARIGRRGCGTRPPARCWPRAGGTRARS